MPRRFLFLRQYWRSLVLLAYLLLGLVGLWNHAMWRDELNVWAIARDSESLGALFAAVNYEGHPSLWYLLLYGVQLLTSNPFGMQLLHGAIAGLTGWLFLVYAPFKPLQKTVFLFGYFPFFEYYLISRNYSLGILCLVAVCALYSRRRRGYGGLALLLALGANTSAYCLFLTGAIALTLTLEYCCSRFFGLQTQANVRNALISLGIYGSGVLVSLLQLLPPTDSYLHGGSSLRIGFNLYRLVEVLSQVWVSHTLVVQPADRFWDLAFFTLLSLALILFFGWVLRDRPVSLLLYIVGNTIILSFAYLKFAGGLRHYGHLYILLILCLWLAQSDSQASSETPGTQADPLSRPLADPNQPQMPHIPALFKQRNQSFAQKSYPFVFNIILGLQLIMGLITFTNDFITPYSASKAVARYLQREGLVDHLLVGNPDMVMTPISGYLNQPIYRAETQDWGSYVLFKQGRQDASHTDVLVEVKQLLEMHKQPILLILNRKLEQSSKELEIEFLEYFPDGVIHDEEYYLYKISPNS
ncbi:MAG: hypothetical protein AAGG51_23985 [Cyanobacteria bacterium P01_G01_bin.54]